MWAPRMFFCGVISRTESLGSRAERSTIRVLAPGETEAEDVR